MISGRGQSKIDSFERWNEKKNKNTKFELLIVCTYIYVFDSDNGGERGFGGRREVTAFDFDSEPRSHNNGSPELGIREVIYY